MFSLMGSRRRTKKHSIMSDTELNCMQSNNSKISFLIFELYISVEKFSKKILY